MENKISEYVNSVFEQPWWLDVVAPDAWKEILIKEEGEIIARWPIVEIGNTIGMPPLTQTIGFWLSEKIIESDTYYTKRKRTTNLLLEQLPINKCIQISLNSVVNYFLPMKWKNYLISPFISYVINDLGHIDSIFNRFSNKVKRNIKSASKSIVVKTIDDIEILLVLLDKTFDRQNIKYPISKDIIRNIYRSCKEYNAGKLLYAVDLYEQVHSGCLFVYDKNVCYYLISGSDPKFRNSGAISLLIWEGIKFASTVSKSFDFEGSMIEGIENFFRQFGGTPTVYYHISKQKTNQNIFLEIFELLKPRIKALIRYKK